MTEQFWCLIVILFNYPKAVKCWGRGALDIKVCFIVECVLFESYFAPINIMDFTQEFNALHVVVI
jgi:hypothetical protein